MGETTKAAADVTSVDVTAGIGKLVAEQAKDVTRSDGFQAQMFKAIAVQRPVVVEYLKSLRRVKPDASAQEILKDLDSRYVATVTTASTGVGASAAIPGVGVPLALGLGVADLLFFYETSALYVLAVAELHGVAVDDVERARPLVLGMLLGQKSQSQVSKLVMSAMGAGAIENARGAAARGLPKGWGDVLTQQLPDSALAPLTVVLGREALKTGGKLGAGTLGKAIPFGVGAAIGGFGSYYFGRDVVKSARLAFPEQPEDFPDWLQEFEKEERLDQPPSRAVLALQAAAGSVKDFGEDVWGKVGAAADLFRSVDIDGDGIPDEARALTAVKTAGATVAGVGARATRAFRSEDLDGDGEPDQPQALTAAMNAGSAVKGAAAGLASKSASLFKRKKALPDEEPGAVTGEDD